MIPLRAPRRPDGARPELDDIVQSMSIAPRLYQDRGTAPRASGRSNRRSLRLVADSLPSEVSNLRTPRRAGDAPPFDPGPLLGQPAVDHGLVALSGSAARALQTPAQPAGEDPPHLHRMVVPVINRAAIHDDEPMPEMPMLMYRGLTLSRGMEVAAYRDLGWASFAAWWNYLLVKRLITGRSGERFIKLMRRAGVVDDARWRDMAG
jgi:hypothetical protein